MATGAGLQWCRRGLLAVGSAGELAGVRAAAELRGLPAAACRAGP